MKKYIQTKWLYGGLLGLNAAVILVFWSERSLADLLAGGSQTMLAFGRLLGLFSVLLALSQVYMISRVRWLESGIGFDGITRIHRTLGISVLFTIVGHFVFILLAYTDVLGLPLPEVWLYLSENFPHVVLAQIAAGLFLSLGILASVRKLRWYLSYEQWYFTHLMMYVAILLAYFHQIPNGADFGSELFRYYWYALYLVVFGSLVYFRLLRPISSNLAHKFKVVRVEKDTDGATSVYVSGVKMNEYRYSGGQFAMWIFKQKGFPLQKHPFTISQEFNGREIRLTAKHIGDYTKRMGELKPGARAFIEGPYGIFTPALTSNKKILMIAGGAGITPLRAMIPEMLEQGRNIKMLYGNQTSKDTMLLSEIDKRAENANFSYINILSVEPGAKETGYVDAEKVKRLVLDLKDRDIYLCGPPIMMGKLVPDLVGAGVQPEKIHTERFSL